MREVQFHGCPSVRVLPGTPFFICQTPIEKGEAVTWVVAGRIADRTLPVRDSETGERITDKVQQQPALAHTGCVEDAQAEEPDDG